MKNTKLLAIVVSIFLVGSTVAAYMKFIHVPKITLFDGTVVDGVSIKDSQGLSGTEAEVYSLQDRECGHLFKKFQFTPTSTNPYVLEPLLFPIVCKEIRKRSEFADVSDKEVSDACLTLARVLASDSGRGREDHQKDLFYAAPLPLQSVEFKGEQAALTPAELFKYCYEKKLATNPRLVGMCLDDPSHYAVTIGRYLVSEDLSRGFLEVPDLPGFYLTQTSFSDAYIFHRDPNFQTLLEKKARVVSIGCSIPVEDEKGNMYPLNITVYKNPFNNRWWVHRAQRTVNLSAQNGWPIVY